MYMYVYFIGKHCCLWCLTPQDKSSLHLRTTQSIADDYGKFTASGGNLKRAKLFNNAIREPLDQVTDTKIICIYMIDCTS